MKNLKIKKQKKIKVCLTNSSIFWKMATKKRMPQRFHRWQRSKPRSDTSNLKNKLTFMYKLLLICRGSGRMYLSVKKRRRREKIKSCGKCAKLCRHLLIYSMLEVGAGAVWRDRAALPGWPGSVWAVLVPVRGDAGSVAFHWGRTII